MKVLSLTAGLVRGGAGKYKVPGARHVLRGSSQVLRSLAFIKLFSLERDTRKEMLEKLRLRCETFSLETNEKKRTKFWYRRKRWKPVGSTGTGRVEVLRPAGHPGRKTGQNPFFCS